MKTIRSTKSIFNGILLEATVEITTAGAGNCAYPTEITIRSDCSGNEFDLFTGYVDKEGYREITSTPEVNFKICGELENQIIGELFVWIGEEIKKMSGELREVKHE